MGKDAEAGVPKAAKCVAPIKLTDMGLEELDRLIDETPDWPKDKLKEIQHLPLHLHRLTDFLYCDSHPYAQDTGKDIIDGSLVQLYAPSGRVDMGWGSEYLVDGFGHFSDGSSRGPSGDGFLVKDFNKYCFVAWTPKMTFKDPIVPQWGASVLWDRTVSWRIDAGKGGRLFVGFNDEDDNNSGGFEVYLDQWRTKSYLQWIRGAVVQRHNSRRHSKG